MNSIVVLHKSMWGTCTFLGKDITCVLNIDHFTTHKTINKFDNYIHYRTYIIGQLGLFAISHKQVIASCQNVTHFLHYYLICNL